MKIKLSIIAGFLVIFWMVAGALQTHLEAQNTPVGVISSKTQGILPNPKFTPGSVNPAITQDNISETICNKDWKTGSIRDTQSTPSQKKTTYKLYGITPPVQNIGQTQVCELDHLVSLENSGSDKLDNIWPECGPDNVTLNQRYFKLKDSVENYIHNGICLNVPNAKFSSGPKPPKQILLLDAQKILSTDWYTFYLQSGLNKSVGAISNEVVE